MERNHRIALELTTGSVKIPFLGQHVSINILLLILCEGIVFVLTYLFFSSLSLSTGLGAESMRIEPYLYSFILIASISTQGLYRINTRHNPLEILTRVSLSFAMSLAFIISLSYLFTLTLSSPSIRLSSMIGTVIVSEVLPAAMVTWPLVITRGPNKQRQNLGIYRQQVIGRNRVIMRWLSHRGGALDYRAWQQAHPGERQANLDVASDDPDEPSVDVLLAGEGLEPPQFSIDPTSLYAALLTGESEPVDSSNAPGYIRANRRIVLKAVPAETHVANGTLAH